MKVRTSLIISLQNINCRNNGFRLKVGDVKALRTDRVAPLLVTRRGATFNVIMTKPCCVAIGDAQRVTFHPRSYAKRE